MQLLCYFFFKTGNTWGEMSVIYILQNAGFSGFPDQASCLEGWGPEFQKSARPSDPEPICGRWPQEARGPALTGGFPSTPRAPGGVFI